MKIGVDLDDVLLDCNGSLAPYHNAHYGTLYERKDVRSWFLHEIWKCTQEQAIARVKEWYISQEHSESIPILGAPEAIEELAKYHELHIITSRPKDVTDLTMKWLEQYFPNRFKSVHFTSHSEPGSGSKAEICTSLGVALLVEDSLIHARAVAESGVTVLLLDAPWNQEQVSGNIIRLSTWEAVLSYLGQ